MTDILEKARSGGDMDSTFRQAANTNHEWYEPDLSCALTPEIRQWWESYTNLKGYDLDVHLYRQRGRAFALGEYPCVGTWDFLGYRIPRLVPDYAGLLERVRAGAVVLDVGCCFGQDMRRLAVDSGADTSRWFGTDLHSELWDIGRDLFRDADTFKAGFIQADLLDPQSQLWHRPELMGKVDIMIACQVFHIFSWEQHLQVLSSIATKLSKPDTVILGLGIANVEAFEVKTQWGQNYLHNVETFEKLWSEVGERTGTRWKVNAKLLTVKETGYSDVLARLMGDKGRYIWFVVTRQA